MDRCESGVRREIVDPEGELIPGETIVKLYYCKRLDGYVTVPGASLFKVAAVAPSVHPGEGGVTRPWRFSMSELNENTIQLRG